MDSVNYKIKYQLFRNLHKPDSGYAEILKTKFFGLKGD